MKGNQILRYFGNKGIKTIFNIPALMDLKKQPDVQIMICYDH